MPVSGTLSWSELDREGEEHTDDVDSHAFPSSAIVLVLKVQVFVVPGQLLLR